jgi:hypothetical protein
MRVENNATCTSRPAHTALIILTVLQTNRTEGKCLGAQVDINASATVSQGNQLGEI